MITSRIKTDTSNLIYKQLNKLDKIPKLKDVDTNIKELVRAELTLIKCNSVFNIPYYSYNKLNITDRLVDSFIGKILKRMRKEYYLYNALIKRTKISKDRIKTVVLYYYNLPDGTQQLRRDGGYSNWKGVSSSWQPMSIEDQLRRDFIKLLMSDKSISVENANISVLEKYNKSNKELLENYISLYFK